MARIKLYNARILDVKKMTIFEGEIHVDDNVIKYVGKSTDSKEFDKFVNCHGNLLMPGFKNAHTHSGMTGLRSYCDDAELQTWLFDKIIPAENVMTADDIYWLSKLAILEYLQSGITTNFDMYNYPFHAAKASADLGFRTVITGCINYFGETVDMMKKMYSEMNKISPLVTYKLGFHSVYTISEDYLKMVSEVAHDLEQPVYAHMCETEKEVSECRQQHGKTPFKYLDSLGLLDNGGAFFHCIYVDSDEIKLLNKHKCSIVTCPSSNLKLTSGICDVDRYLKEGIRVGLGTDGPASNNSLDMFKEMFLMSTLSKIKVKDPTAVKASEAIKAATWTGAHILGLPEVSNLEEGKLADIIMIDLHQPNMQPLNNIVANLVYAGNKINVKMTMIDGKILYANGNFYLGEDVETIYEKCSEIAERIKKEAHK